MIERILGYFGYINKKREDMLVKNNINKTDEFVDRYIEHMNWSVRDVLSYMGSNIAEEKVEFRYGCQGQDHKASKEVGYILNLIAVLIPNMVKRDMETIKRENGYIQSVLLRDVKNTPLEGIIHLPVKYWIYLYYDILYTNEVEESVAKALVNFNTDRNREGNEYMNLFNVF